MAADNQSPGILSALEGALGLTPAQGNATTADSGLNYNQLANTALSGGIALGQTYLTTQAAVKSAQANATAAVAAANNPNNGVAGISPAMLIIGGGLLLAVLFFMRK